MSDSAPQFARRPDAPQPGRILIRATNWIGDAVMSLPAVRAVRERFPQAFIAVLARPWVADLYRSEGAVNRIILYTAKPGFRDIGEKVRFARGLRRERFDLAILFPNSFEAAAVARIAEIPQVIGYRRDGRGWMLTQGIATPRPGEIPPHERFRYLEMLRRAGLADSLPSAAAIRLEGIAGLREAGRRTFAAHGLAEPVIGLSPGAAYGTAKRWLPERFVETAIALAREHQAAVCIFGSGGERELCEQIANQIAAHAQVINLAGETSLRGFMEAAAACLVFVSNDSGAMHVASALGTPTVTVFGATNPVATGPTGDLARVIRHPVPCSPCLLRECPIDHRCMTGVSAANAVAAAHELLSIAGVPAV